MEESYKKTRILITGSDGQLGQCLKKIEEDHLNLEMYFTDYDVLDITKKEDLLSFFSKNKFNYVINCAAYTNVEQAEKEPQKAFEINATGVKNIAEVCLEYDITLLHISTDYVFDGEKGAPYTEIDKPNPINEYGKSKLAGEQYAQNILEKYFVVRTSWLYSEFGRNFFKTILRKSESESELTITTSEIGTPTNANDLAKFLILVIQLNSDKYGVYHFSNLGEATWYDFTSEILSVSGKLNEIKLEKTDNYPTFAVRPKYSVLDKGKCLNLFDLEIPNWRASLREAIKN